MHDLGPEIRRAISGNLDEEEFIDKEIEEPMHRVGNSHFGLRFSCALLEAHDEHDPSDGTVEPRSGDHPKNPPEMVVKSRGVLLVTASLTWK